MTNEQMQAIKDDLAYMRALADEGRRAPLLGGSILVVAGLVYGAASVAHWAIVSGALDVHRAALSVVWGVAVLVFMAALFIIKGRLAGRPGALAISNKAYGIAWGGLGAACFGLALSLIVASLRMNDAIFMGLFPPVILSLYGAGWLVAAGLSDRRWLRWVGFASVAAAVGTAWMLGQDEQWLVYAAALVLLAALPGFALMRQEPTEVV